MEAVPHFHIIYRYISFFLLYQSPGCDGSSLNISGMVTSQLSLSKVNSTNTNYGRDFVPTLKSPLIILQLKLVLSTFQIWLTRNAIYEEIVFMSYVIWPPRDPDHWQVKLSQLLTICGAFALAIWNVVACLLPGKQMTLIRRSGQNYSSIRIRSKYWM